MADRPPLPTSTPLTENEALRRELDAVVNDMENTLVQIQNAVATYGPPTEAQFNESEAIDILPIMRRLNAAMNGIGNIRNALAAYGPPQQTIADNPRLQVTAGHIVREVRCSICIGDFVLGETVQLLPCGHIFHEACIAQWVAHTGGNNSDGATETSSDVASSEPFARASGTNEAGSNEEQLTPPHDDEVQNNTDE